MIMISHMNVELLNANVKESLVVVVFKFDIQIFVFQVQAHCTHEVYFLEQKYKVNDNILF